MEYLDQQVILSSGLLGIVQEVFEDCVSIKVPGHQDLLLSKSRLLQNKSGSFTEGTGYTLEFEGEEQSLKLLRDGVQCSPKLLHSSFEELGVLLITKIVDSVKFIRAEAPQELLDKLEQEGVAYEFVD